MEKTDILPMVCCFFFLIAIVTGCVSACYIDTEIARIELKETQISMDTAKAIVKICADKF